MILAHPSGHDLLHGLATLPLGHKSYVYLLAANVGAVIMPWMIFYQQSAIVDKGLRPTMLRAERRDTAAAWSPRSWSRWPAPGASARCWAGSTA
jgi:Mn2+/Fe2+ NRAMP family transporter